MQKNSCRIILGEKYEDYQKSLEEIGLETLEERRRILALKFGKNCIQNTKTQNLFPLRKKIHKIKTRKEEKFKVIKARKKRLQKSTVPNLQRLLNEEHLKVNEKK